MTNMPVCRISGQPLHAFLDLGMMPVANAFLTKAQLAEPEFKFPLRVGFCETSLMVQLIETVDPAQLFHANYAYFSSISRVMEQHFAQLADAVAAELLYDKRLPVVEIGSNDGILLAKLAAHAPAVGIEPSGNVAAAARARGLDVICEFFEPGLAARLRAERGAAQLVVGANVLCHIPDLNALARSLDVLLDSNGIFIFEDPYLLEIITQLAYDQIYDEHYFYFSVHSLSRLFAAHGLRIFRVEALPVHGGSMRVYGCRAGAQRATEPGVQAQLALEQQHGLHQLQTYVDFAERVRQSRAALYTMLYDLKRSGRRIAGYAASSKGTVVLNYCGIGPQLLDYICDNTPGKQGLYAPGTHIPVLPIEHFAADRPDFAFVLAWNHMREIMAKEQAFTAAGGRFITHIPSAAIV